MDAINLGAFLTFVIITTFTPGPNNITSSSMGILYGYRRSLIYIAGIVSGFFVIMFIAGIISRTLYSIFPSLEIIMRIIGALYILWLAYKTFKSSYNFSDEETTPLGYISGLLLQALNPKVWIFALTLYTTFLVPVTDNLLFLSLSAIFLAFVAFCATSTWALSGALIKRYLQNERFQKIINLVLTLLLVYTALDLSGLISLLRAQLS